MSFEQARTITTNLFTTALPFLGTWRPKICFEIRQSRYIIKTAQTKSEFEDVIRLRTEVFLEEFAGKAAGSSYDLEERDYDADFIIIKDASSHEVMACYRLLSSEFTNDFYSKTEFDISDFLRVAGNKLELSRACVRSDKRSKGIFVHLLWRGLAEYITLSGSRFLFGCSSIQTLDLVQLVQIYRYLGLHSYHSNEFDIHPLGAYRIFDSSGILSFPKSDLDENAEVPLPSLLMSYLKAGAKVYGTPAYDQDFACLDFFTVLDFESGPSSHTRKYLGTI